MSRNTQKRRQLSTPRASLCVLGQVMSQICVLEKLKEVKIPQKVLRYTPQQKVAAVLGGMLFAVTQMQRNSAPQLASGATLCDIGLQGARYWATMSLPLGDTPKTLTLTAAV